MSDWTEAVKAFQSWEAQKISDERVIQPVKNDFNKKFHYWKFHKKLQFVKPEHPSEAQIVGELYHRLRNEKILAYLEYPCIQPRGRFDLVIVKDKQIRLIIEGKSQDQKVDYPQLKRYLEFGAPILLIGKWNDIDECVRVVKYRFLPELQDAKAYKLAGNSNITEIRFP